MATPPSRSYSAGGVRAPIDVPRASAIFESCARVSSPPSPSSHEAMVEGVSPRSPAKAAWSILTCSRRSLRRAPKPFTNVLLPIIFLSGISVLLFIPLLLWRVGTCARGVEIPVEFGCELSDFLTAPQSRNVDDSLFIAHPVERLSRVNKTLSNTFAQ